jgi:DnaK suppressor protein
MQSFPSDLLNQIRTHLEEEKTALAVQIDELTKQDPFSDPERLIDNAATDGDAAEESDHDRMAAQIDELNHRRDDIDQALMRISEGTYGFCGQCGEMIDTDRLGILPMATLCKNCEEKRKKSPVRA